MPQLTLRDLLLSRAEIEDSPHGGSVYALNHGKRYEGDVRFTCSEDFVCDRLVIYLGWMTRDHGFSAMNKRSGAPDASWNVIHTEGPKALHRNVLETRHVTFTAPVAPLSYTGSLFSIDWFIKVQCEYNGLNAFLMSRPSAQQLIMIH